MGLVAGPVPPRVDAHVKAGLLALVAHAPAEGGWSLRKAAAALGLEHVRVLRWLGRAAGDRLIDNPARRCRCTRCWTGSVRRSSVAKEWGGIDRSHRKLAHRGSRL